MSDIQGPGSVDPQDASQIYRSEYERGTNLFEDALNQADKTSYDPKKEEFNEVMNQAMEILNQSARGLKNEKLLEQNKKIGEDYKSYQGHPDKAHLDALRKDLKQAKDSLE